MESLRIHDIIEHMIRTEHKHRAVCDRELSSLGLHRSQMRMLMHLWRGGGEMPQHQLARELHVSAAVVTVALKKLESEGYVTRTPSASDRRTVVISLAPRGLESVQFAHGTLDRVDTNMLAGFTESEKRELIDFYTRMFANLAGIDEDIDT